MHELAKWPLIKDQSHSGSGDKMRQVISFTECFLGLYRDIVFANAIRWKVENRNVGKHGAEEVDTLVMSEYV